MKSSIFCVLALALSSLSFPSSACGGPHVLVFDGSHVLSLTISSYADDEVTRLGSFTLGDIDEPPIREFPWQVSLSFDGDNGDDGSGLNFAITILHTILQEELNLNFAEYRPDFDDDDDLDLFLVNAPGGDNSVRFGGVLSAAHVPEPSTLALLLLATLFTPLGARIARNRNG